MPLAFTQEDFFVYGINNILVVFKSPKELSNQIKITCIIIVLILINNKGA